MTPTRRRVAAMALIFSASCLLPGAILAQDSFGGQTSQRPSPTPRAPVPPPPRTTPPPMPPSTQGSGSLDEAQDFGVPATQKLRPSDQLGGPTPTRIPGGRVIATQQLVQLLQAKQGAPMLLHAYHSMEHLPGAIAVVPAAQGGSFDDEVQRGFGQYLQQATNGDVSRMLVFYCGGPQCWGSYNASLRAIHLGYRNVHWYRGGVQAWRQAGLPVQTAPDPGAQP
ncbi:rhodanese-like domain-containing protein [Pseudoxanthomonas broegbernensis]|nr:rhodanese-like domain-containing protein [Pseudoxanthomonas broegbernensis]MBB6063906.1 PQQ-dependent catabolism-associated CXXCW motif protein [Pseudoxanthomonas broegbernensis]